MSTPPVSGHSIYQETQMYFRQRTADLSKLGHALQSGDLASAEKEFQAIQTLGKYGPFANGDAFKFSQRQQDFEAIGRALQSGDLSGAKQAFVELKTTFQHVAPPPATPEPAASTQSNGVNVTA